VRANAAGNDSEEPGNENLQGVGQNGKVCHSLFDSDDAQHVRWEPMYGGGVQTAAPNRKTTRAGTPFSLQVLRNAQKT
jgi:hypothetical protein